MIHIKKPYRPGFLSSSAEKDRNNLFERWKPWILESFRSLDESNPGIFASWQLIENDDEFPASMESLFSRPNIALQLPGTYYGILVNVGSPEMILRVTVLYKGMRRNTQGYMEMPIPDVNSNSDREEVLDTLCIYLKDSLYEINNQIKQSTW